MPTARTSESHPLRITAMTLGDGRGRIGFSQCPGRIDRYAISGPWKRDLDTDLDAIQRWGATAVVSLITHEEIPDLKVHDLPRAVRDRHMEWWHAPIPDGEAPEQDFEHAWKATGESIRNRLRLGFDVLLHCRGGLGRAGTITARLLVELGVQPDDAIRRVRDAREWTIENDSQLAHVRQCSAQAPSVPSRTADDIHDRALGAFLGLAVGDAVGTTLEFCSRDTQPRLEDMVGGGPFDLPAGAWTDDTAMALALADSLAESKTLDCRDLMDRFVKWWRDGDYSWSGDCFDIGNTTCQALTRYLRTGDPVAGSTDPLSAGNGSLMRLAPVALRFRHDRPRLLAAAADQSRTTHGAEEAVDACRAFGAAPSGRHRRVTVLGRSGSETVHGSGGNHSGHSRQLARTDTGYDPLQRVRRSHARSRHLVSRPHRRLPRRGAARGQPGRRRRYGSSSDGAARRRPLRPERHPRPLAGTRCLEGSTPGSGAAVAVGTPCRPVEVGWVAEARLLTRSQTQTLSC